MILTLLCLGGIQGELFNLTSRYRVYLVDLITNRLPRSINGWFSLQEKTVKRVRSRWRIC